MSLFGKDFRHQRVVSSAMDAAPDDKKATLNDILQHALAVNIPWLKIMMAFATAAAGGFTPASIAAAIAMLFGNNPPASLKAAATAP